MKKFKMAATCMLGIEGLLANELRRMNACNVTAENGRVLFEGDSHILARANIQSRFAERILVVMGMFKATTFDELFEGVKSLEWGELIGKNDKFPVTGRSLSSKLASVPDCQKIIKKAVADKLNMKYHVGYFEETGSLYQIKFLILKDNVTVMVDTSGAGLHKRGYRAVSNDAPIKETLAAALVDLSRVRESHTVYDPFCGSGTILIEAAMKAMNIAPGLNREFVSQTWQDIDSGVWNDERQLAESQVISDCAFTAYGSDIDDKALKIAKENAIKAGVSDKIKFKCADIREFETYSEYATVICNPPYGERLLSTAQAEEIYTIMGKKFLQKAHHSYTVISPEDNFEKLFGKKADKRRKLYNGMIQCQVYMYYKNN